MRGFGGSRWVGALFVAGALAFGVWILGGVMVALFGPEPPGPGDPAPGFDLVALSGGRTALDDLRDEVVLLDFWATTCVGCIGATPRLNRLHADYRDRGFSVVSVNQEPDDVPRVQRVVRERNIRYPVLIDPGHVADDYGVAAFPTVVLVDREGVIQAVHEGPVAESRLRREIEALLPPRRRPRDSGR